MRARVLVVDDVGANRRLLADKLALDYHETMTAEDGAEAIAAARAHRPDVLLLDVMMPGIDGFEVCRVLKADPLTRHIPIIMVSALDDRASRLKGLEAGADDFLTKPIDEKQLMARVRNVMRVKPLLDELRAREESGRRFGLIEGAEAPDSGLGARILLVDPAGRFAAAAEQALSGDHRILHLGGPQNAGALRPDLAIVGIGARPLDGLRFVAHLVTSDAHRNLPILAVAEYDAPERAERALELGAHDLAYAPVDVDELALRVRTLIKRKRYVDALRASVDQGLEMAVIDPLTGLHNRRFLLRRLEALTRRAASGGEQFSMLLADIDHFKRINDVHGHESGDAVLKAFSARLAAEMRPLDVVCRFGGEEFIVLLPGVSGDAACLAAERLRRAVAGEPFALGERRLNVTVSIGVADFLGGEDSPEALLRRADQALYAAKLAGRNRVSGRAA